MCLDTIVSADLTAHFRAGGGALGGNGGLLVEAIDVGRWREADRGGKFGNLRRPSFAEEDPPAVNVRADAFGVGHDGGRPSECVEHGDHLIGIRGGHDHEPAMMCRPLVGRFLPIDHC